MLIIAICPTLLFTLPMTSMDHVNSAIELYMEQSV